MKLMIKRKNYIFYILEIENNFGKAKRNMSLFGKLQLVEPIYHNDYSKYKLVRHLNS